MQEKDLEQKTADEALRKLRHREYEMSSQVGAQTKSMLLHKLFMICFMACSLFIKFSFVLPHVPPDQHC